MPVQMYCQSIDFSITWDILKTSWTREPFRGSPKLFILCAQRVSSHNIMALAEGRSDSGISGAIILAVQKKKSEHCVSVLFSDLWLKASQTSWIVKYEQTVC